MVVGTGVCDNCRDYVGYDKTDVDLQIREPDEPAIALSTFELARRFGAADTTRGIFTTQPNAQQETESGEGSKRALDGAVSAIGSGGKSGEDEEDDGRDEERPFAGVVISGVAEDEDANDLADEGEGGDVRAGVGGGVGFAVDGFEEGVDGADSLRSVNCVRKCVALDESGGVQNSDIRLRRDRRHRR